MATSTERVRRWRERHPAEDREQGRRAQARYRRTAKGLLAAARAHAKERGNR